MRLRFTKNTQIFTRHCTLCRTATEAVNNKFIELEDEITLSIAQKFADLGVKKDNLNERIHFAMDIVQSFSHEYVYDHHTYIDYDAMRNIVKDTLVALFENK